MSAVTRPVPTTGSASDLARTLVVVVIGSIMAVLDVTIVNIGDHGRNRTGRRPGRWPGLRIGRRETRWTVRPDWSRGRTGGVAVDGRQRRTGRGPGRFDRS